MQSSIISVIEASKGDTGMEVQLQHHGGVELDMEFWPLQHPTEPDDEDRPVVCPMPHSSLDGTPKLHGKRTPESWRKRTEVSREAKAGGTGEVRAVRKRHHHTLSPADHHLIAGISPLPPLPAQNLTIFQMLQQLEKFESS